MAVELQAGDAPSSPELGNLDSSCATVHLIMTSIENTRRRFRKDVPWILLGMVGCVALECSMPAAAAGQAARRLIPGVPVIRIDEVRYEVTGATPGEILNALQTVGPRVEGTTYFGYTRWDIKWSFRYAPSSTGCRMTSVTVTLAGSVELPEWRAPAGADRSLTADWEEFLANLRTHEEGHVELAMVAAREIQRALERVEMPVCEMMAGHANGLGRRRLQALTKDQLHYDRETRRGATQGAEWPVRRSPGGLQ